MFDRIYRTRLLQDLARWEAAGTLTPETAAAARAALGPEPRTIGLAGYLVIAATLLLAGALLAFVASNWDGIPRLLRLAMLVALISGAPAAGAIYAERGNTLLTDLAMFLGCLAFAASVALVGQMYHLPENFAGGFLLCSLGALAAATLSRSTGALAVALVTAVAWSGESQEQSLRLHWPFLVAWAVAAGVSMRDDKPAARHLVAAAAVAWAGVVELAGHRPGLSDATAVIVMLLGCALLAAGSDRKRIAAFGDILAIYAFFALAGTAFLGSVGPSYWRTPAGPIPGGEIQHVAMALGLAGLAIAAAIGRARALAMTGLAASAAVLVLNRAPIPNDFRLHGFLALVAALTLIVGGAYAGRRPVFIAGWIAFALVVGNLTWFAAPTFLERAVFLALAGGIAVAAALALRRLEASRPAP